MILKPLTDDPVEKSKGILKGKSSLLKSLLEDRKKEAKVITGDPEFKEMGSEVKVEWL